MLGIAIDNEDNKRKIQRLQDVLNPFENENFKINSSFP